MGVEIKQALMSALGDRFFPALARWLAEAGVSVEEAIDLLVAAAISQARKSIPEGVDPDSISLISTRTGLSRRRIREARAEERMAEKTAGAGGHRGERVLAGWWHDADFLDRQGQPRILSITQGPHSFEDLCRRYSGERQHRTILNDLKQAGAVVVLPSEDRVQTLRRSYAAVGWTEAGQREMAEQLAEHIETGLNNFKHPQGSQHWVCRRVSNALVHPDYAKILLRDIRSDIESQADTVYDQLTAPEHTADPLDPAAEEISYTFYMRRKTGSSVSATDTGVGSAVGSTDAASKAEVATQPSTRRRSRSKSRK